MRQRQRAPAHYRRRCNGRGAQRWWSQRPALNELIVRSHYHHLRLFAILLFVIDFVLLSPIIEGSFWIPFIGPFLQLSFLIVQLSISWKMAGLYTQYLSPLSGLLNQDQKWRLQRRHILLITNLISILAAFIGLIMQQADLRRAQTKCQNVGNGYKLPITTMTQGSYGTSSSLNTAIATTANWDMYNLDNSQGFWQCARSSYNLEFIFFSAIVVPVFELVHICLMSLYCWKIFWICSHIIATGIPPPLCCSTHPLMGSPLELIQPSTRYGINQLLNTAFSRVPFMSLYQRHALSAQAQIELSGLPPPLSADKPPPQYTRKRPN